MPRAHAAADSSPPGQRSCESGAPGFEPGASASSLLASCAGTATQKMFATIAQSTGVGITNTAGRKVSMKSFVNLKARNEENQRMIRDCARRARRETNWGRTNLSEKVETGGRD